MSRLPPSAHTHLNDAGLIFADEFNDSYFSRDDGLAESQAVFLAGCDLPHGWADRSSFVIGELGFGTGLNVLATWDLWNKHRPLGGILHIFTVEGFLLDAKTAQAVHRHWPQLRHLSDQLVAKWPTRAYGAQRIWFPDDGVCLTFLIGPCEDVLSRMAFQADCWFLDGFAPSRNLDMWSPRVLAHVARLSAPQARLATYSVAGSVRAGLVQAGFDVRRVPGFGSKRQRLEAHRLGAIQLVPKCPQTAIVIGGGIAGASVSAALIRRGLKVELFDADPCARTKASGNPVALIMPRLDRADTREGRFFRAAYVMAVDAYNSMGEAAFRATGVHEVGADEAACIRLTNLVDDPPLPPDHITNPDGQSLIHLQGGLAYPDAVLKHLTLGARCHPIAVNRVSSHDGAWHAYDEAGHCLATADICVVANGPGAALFCNLGASLRGRAGQLSWASVDDAIPEVPLSGGAYAAPFHHRLVFGATYEHCEIGASPPPVTLENHRLNRDKLAVIAPNLAGHIDINTASGRSSVRAATPDQLPVVGAVEGEGPGKFILCALGSRGFTTAFLCAEIIASQACGEPSPVEIDVAIALAPDRFAKRAAKRAS